MRKLLSSLSFVIISLLFLFSCKKDNDAVPNMGYRYFPDNVGRYVVYDVDSTFYDDNAMNTFTHISPAVNYKFQIKEKIESISTDNLNRPTIRLERYVKYYNDTLAYNFMPWTFRNVWTENKTATTAEKVEENIRYTKLAFPVKESQVWNGNAQNINAAQNYSYAYFDQPLQMGIFAFDSVLQVTQKDESTLINKHYEIEKYACNAGMIFKQSINVGFQPNALWNDSTTNYYFSLPILQHVTSGSQCTMTVAYYGTE